MKKFSLIIASLIVSVAIQAQLTFDYFQSGNKGRALSKFHISGYKYVETDIPNLTIKIYNLNHTLFKTISVPSQTLPAFAISHVTENLFDTDNFIEYVLVTRSTGSGPGWHYELRVLKESGTQIFYRDSAYLGGTSTGFNVFANGDPVYYDGVNTKLRMVIGNSASIFSGTEYYNLAGSIPCVLCSASGTIIGIGDNSGEFENEKATFYPNPVKDHLKLKYKLPADYKSAGIKIYDTQGKLLEDFQITDSFNYIYLPSSYDNGLYFYSLIVNDKIIKTEKIILSK